MIKRFFDLSLAIPLALIFALPIAIIAVAVRITSKGPAVHWSKRVGRNNKLFLMPKFRSMKIDTPQIATHLVSNPKSFLTPIGGFLRVTSLDELPQIYSVLVGDMSFVGPRPALFNQDDLIQLRTECGVDKIQPGITGWAQINGRDELPIPEKVQLDKYYLDHMSAAFDLKILFLTALKVIKRDGITH
ncbi:MAG: sugar transferase [Bdellovibrio sp.]|nr:sugar transferase [Bdellovibrio sp.]